MEGRGFILAILAKQVYPTSLRGDEALWLLVFSLAFLPLLIHSALSYVDTWNRFSAVTIIQRLAGLRYMFLKNDFWILVFLFKFSVDGHRDQLPYRWSLAVSHCLFTDTIEHRVENINNYFTFSLYCNVCRSLFEKHKLLFAFLLCSRLGLHHGKIDTVRRSTHIIPLAFVLFVAERDRQTDRQTSRQTDRHR